LRIYLIFLILYK